MSMFMFPFFEPEVDSLDHPDVTNLRQLIEDGCILFGGEVTNFAVHRGMVAFCVTSQKHADAILAIWKGKGVKVVADVAAFKEEADKMLREHG